MAKENENGPKIKICPEFNRWTTKARNVHMYIYCLKRKKSNVFVFILVLSLSCKHSHGYLPVVSKSQHGSVKKKTP